MQVEKEVEVVEAVEQFMVEVVSTPEDMVAVVVKVAVQPVVKPPMLAEEAVEVVEVAE